MCCDRFDLSPEQILSALASPDLVIEPAPDVELPQHLVDPQEIEATMQVRSISLCVTMITCARESCHAVLCWQHLVGS